MPTVSTTISTWGNSAAIRIPRSMLDYLSLKVGDTVNITCNNQKSIEIIPQNNGHRSVRPMAGVTFESLFKDYYGGRCSDMHAWQDAEDTFYGAEKDAWQQ